MLTLSSLAFASPWLLGFLAVLPLLWWLLRLMPPSPQKILFPALSLLKGLTAREETPARSPWWLLLLRLLIVGLLIVAFARPLLDPVASMGGKGALLIAIDNDWAAARDWPARQVMLHDMLRDAKRDGRSVVILPTTVSAEGEPLAASGLLNAEAALAQIDQLTPQPWPADWRQASIFVPQLKSMGISEAVWIASGVGGIDTRTFYDSLHDIAPVKVFGTGVPILTVVPPVSEGDALSVSVMRAVTEGATNVTLNAVAGDGNILAHWPVNFVEGSPRVVMPLDLPLELRNRVTHFKIEGQRTAASTALLDAAWEHHAVGIVGNASELDRHSLLSEIYYIDRALKPYAALRIDTLDVLLQAKLPVIILTDTGSIGDENRQGLTAWINHGGILVRFVGERFAAVEDHASDAGLLPVPLRAGGRSLGGALTWGSPQKLQAFPATSPFSHLAVPDDVTVSRQVLAEPSADVAAKTWAALPDGTPLVTAAPMGQGISVLFHVPARAGWSNLPISGLFVGMLQRILQLSRADHATGFTPATALPPLHMLDAFGEMHAPGPNVLALAADAVASTAVGPQHPPGLYGADANTIALNLGAMIGQPEALRNVPLEIYTVDRHDTDLQPYLLLAALLLLLGDFIISLRMRGFLKFAWLLLGLFTYVHNAEAATDDKTAVELTSKTYLAYVHTGDATVDHTSELGLHGLAAMLQNRTSIDEVGVASVDPDADDLTFFPLVYWPVIPGEHTLTPEGAKRVNYYLQRGGMILFDAVNGDDAAPGFLQHVLAGVDLPPLIRLPEQHVLKHTFYRLDDVPGRFTGHDFWLEPEEASAYDGVATVLYGSNGWAAAWAVDANGHASYPCVPGGEIQREYAFRFGINLVMYALTGNYKNDQIHASALLKKMGK